MRSPFLFAIAPVITVVVGLARWLLQGSSNVYTATSKRFFVPDPDLGYRPTAAGAGPIWIGLEVLAMLVAVVLGTLGAAWIIRRRERKLGRRWGLARWVVGIGAALPLGLPIVALASGGRPAGGLDALPTTSGPVIGAGIVGTLAAPAGRYAVVAAPSSISAKLDAGGESFDARFAGGLEGYWQGSPGDLRAPMSAEMSAAAASVDTGVDGRSKHAREGFLYTDKHPRIGFRLGVLSAATQTSPEEIAFEAAGVLLLMGGEHAASVVGTLKVADAAAQARLGVTGDVLILRAATSLLISQTALAVDKGSFDADLVPIQVTLVLVRASS